MHNEVETCTEIILAKVNFVIVLLAAPSKSQNRKLHRIQRAP